MIISKDHPRAAFSEGERTTLKYLVAVLEAEKAGYPRSATLFRETGRAKRVNTSLHFQAPRRHGGEAAEKRDQEPPKRCAAAGGQEKKPSDPYLKALKKLAEMSEGDYYVCAGCGSTWEKQRPEKCPGCRSVAINYIKVG